MKLSMFTNRRIGEFHDLNITGYFVSGTLIQRTGFGEKIDKIKKIFNTNFVPGNSFFIYQHPDTKQVVHKRIIITDRLSKNAQYNHYHIAHTRLSEALYASEEPYRDAFFKKIIRVNFGKWLIKNNDIFNLGMIAERYHGHYNVAFSQKEFIATYELPNTKITYGKQGMCHALALKWLAAQGTIFEKEVFTDLIPGNPGEIPEGREEIFTFSIAYNGIGRFYAETNADVSSPKKMTFASSKDDVYKTVKNMTPEEQEAFKANATQFVNELTIETENVALKYMQMYSSQNLMMRRLNANEFIPEHTGKYEVIFSSLKKGGHHGVAIYIDESKSIFKYFDPNHGEFLFKNADDMKIAVMKIINYGKSPDCRYKIEYGYQFLHQQ